MASASRVAARARARDDHETAADTEQPGEEPTAVPARRAWTTLAVRVPVTTRSRPPTAGLRARAPRRVGAGGTAHEHAPCRDEDEDAEAEEELVGIESAIERGAGDRTADAREPEHDAGPTRTRPAAVVHCHADERGRADEEQARGGCGLGILAGGIHERGTARIEPPPPSAPSDRPMRNPSGDARKARMGSLRIEKSTRGSGLGCSTGRQVTRQASKPPRMSATRAKPCVRSSDAAIDERYPLAQYTTIGTVGDRGRRAGRAASGNGTDRAPGTTPARLLGEVADVDDLQVRLVVPPGREVGAR